MERIEAWNVRDEISNGGDYCRGCAVGMSVQVSMQMMGLNLPKECGVMLLPDCTLFPHGGLPLYIFEDRYRKMLADALAGDCVFAVGRLNADGEGGDDMLPLMGTAGLVRASRQGEDGTSQLLLHGVVRVKFLKWLEQKPYPCALIEPVPCIALPKGKDNAAMKTLRGAVEDGTGMLTDEVRTAVLSMLDQADDAGLMADLVAQQFVHDAVLRQELLETESVGERVKKLCGFFDKLGEG